MVCVRLSRILTSPREVEGDAVRLLRYASFPRAGRERTQATHCSEVSSAVGGVGVLPCLRPALI